MQLKIRPRASAPTALASIGRGGLRTHHATGLSWLPFVQPLDRFLRTDRKGTSAAPRRQCTKARIVDPCLAPAARHARLRSGRARSSEAMQLGLHDFVRQRRAEGKAGEPFAGVGGVHIPLAALSRVALADLQQRLSVTPKATFDRSQTPEQIACFRMTGTHLIVPRAFGYKRAGTGSACSAIEDRLDAGRPFHEQLSFTGSLREEQEEARAQSLLSLQAPPFCCMLTLPCGFGKTVVALSIAVKMGLRTLVVVHKEFLLSQWRDRIRQFLPDATVGLLQGTRVLDPGADIMLGMLQTLCNRLSDPECETAASVRSCGLVVIDEAHHMAARWFSELFFALPTRHILGLTATPKRKDGCTPMLHMFMGDFSFVREERLPTEQMHLRQVPYRSKGRVTRELTGPETQRLKTALTQDSARNSLIIDLCRECVEAGRQVLCLSDRLAHLQELLSAFQAAMPHAVASLYVGGQKRAAREIAERDAQMLFGTFAMAQEGLDVPRLDTLILGSPASDVTQAVGRILRPCAAKMTPLVLDIQDDICPAFSRQNQHRAGLYERMGFMAEGEPAPEAEAATPCAPRASAPPRRAGDVCGGPERSVRRRVQIQLPA